MTVLAVALLVVTLGAHPAKTKVAILEVQDVSGDQAAHARLLTQIVTGEVARERSIDSISSAQIREMLGFERQKQLLGCAESSCITELGGALGVDFILTGQLGKIGSRYRLDLTLIDQRKSKAVANAGTFLPAQDDALADAAVDMVNQILVQAGLRDAASAALVTHVDSGGVSHTGAYLSFGAGAALLVGAGVMTALTHATYASAVTDYEGGTPKGQSPNGSRLSWMSPLTDALWVAAVGAAGLGTYLYLSASPSGPSGAGGDVVVGGRF